MDRRNFCKQAAFACGLFKSRKKIPIQLTERAVQWARRYDGVELTGATSAPNGKAAVVGLIDSSATDTPTLQLATISSDGEVHRERRVQVDGLGVTPATADIVGTRDGYVVGFGSWVSRFDADFATQWETIINATINGQTRVTTTTDGFVTAGVRDAPNRLSVKLHGVEEGGDVRWRRKFGEESSKSLGFLQPTNDGVVVGGGFSEFWAARIVSDGTVRWELTSSRVTGSVPTAVTDDDGLVVFAPPKVARIGSSRTIEWIRDYDVFRETVGRIESLSSGGFVVVADEGERLRIVRLYSDGQIRWETTVTSEVVGAANVRGVLERGPSILAIGSTGDGGAGWGVRITESMSSTRPQSSTKTRTVPSPQTSPATGGRSPGTRETMPTPDRSTETAVPGFGVTTTLIAAAGIGAWLRQRE